MTKEYVSTPAAISLQDTDSIPALFFERARRTPHAIVMRRPLPLEQGWEDIDATQFSNDIIDLARGFVGMGLEPGDRLAIMAATSYEWVLIDYAAQTAGLVVVPIYETDSYDQIDWIIEDTGARMVITDTATQARLVQDTRREIDCGVMALDDGCLDIIRLKGAPVAKSVVKERLDKLNPDDLLSIIYTSGTTGKPKGVELTQRNFCYMALMVAEVFPDVIGSKKSRLLLFLPLAHVYARFASYTVLSGKGVLACIPNAKNIINDMQSFKPTRRKLLP